MSELASCSRHLDLEISLLRMVAFFRNDTNSSNISGRGVYGLVLGMLAGGPKTVSIIIGSGNLLQLHFAICETFLRGNETLSIENYTWVGNTG